MMHYTISIPPTSREHYLSGMAALNLPSPRGTGDWHMFQTFYRAREHRSRTFFAGEGRVVNTNELLGDLGVFDCSSVLDECGIPHEGTAYAATHARAIVDLVLGSVMHGRSPEFVRLDDFMPRDSDKQEVNDLLALALKKLDPALGEQVRQWQERQRELDNL